LRLRLQQKLRLRLRRLLCLRLLLLRMWLGLQARLCMLLNIWQKLRCRLRRRCSRLTFNLFNGSWRWSQVCLRI